MNIKEFKENLLKDCLQNNITITYLDNNSLVHGQIFSTKGACLSKRGIIYLNNDLKKESLEEMFVLGHEIGHITFFKEHKENELMPSLWVSIKNKSKMIITNGFCDETTYQTLMNDFHSFQKFYADEEVFCDNYSFDLLLKASLVMEEERINYCRSRNEFEIRCEEKRFEELTIAKQIYAQSKKIAA